MNYSRWSLFMLAGILGLAACRQGALTRESVMMLKTDNIQGEKIPSDSLKAPVVVPVAENKLSRFAAPPTVSFPEISNMVTAGTPEISVAKAPEIRTPGKGGYSPPAVYKMKVTVTVAGNPVQTRALEFDLKVNNPYGFRTLGRKQGLGSDIVYAMAEDRNRNIWIGTESGGLSRYDGHDFYTWTVNSGLHTNTVRAMLLDKAGNLWLGGKGLRKFDGKNFTDYAPLNESAADMMGVFCILQDSRGNIWFSGSHGGVMKFDGKGFTHFTTKQGLAADIVVGLAEDREGNIWISTVNGVSRYNGISFANFSREQGLADNYVWSTAQDKEGNIWFGFRKDGADRYDGKTITHYTRKEGLVGGHQIYADKQGLLWFGGNYSGISSFDGKRFTRFTVENGFPFCSPMAFYEDQSGNFLIATHTAGIVKYNRGLFTLKPDINLLGKDHAGNVWTFSMKEGLFRSDGKTRIRVLDTFYARRYYFTAMLEDKAGHIWLATANQGALKYDGKTFTAYTKKDGLAGEMLTYLYMDRVGNVWLGSAQGLSRFDGHTFTNYTTEQGLSGNYIFSMTETRNGEFWFALKDKVITRFDPAKQAFTHYSLNLDRLDGHVLKVFEDSDGMLWFGHWEAGLTAYDGKTFISFTQEDGLSNNTVMDIMEDKQGNLWFATQFGLSRINAGKRKMIGDKTRLNEALKEKVLFTNYTYREGFTGTQCSPNSMLETSDGTLLSGNQNGVVEMRMERDRADTVPPAVQLSRVNLFSQEINWRSLMRKPDSSFVLKNGVLIKGYRFDSLHSWMGYPQGLSLPYNNNTIQFQFAGVTHKNSYQVIYRCKLDGWDKNWSAGSSSNEATYSNLSPGQYTFRMQAMNSAGVWSKEFSYGFVIRPPWWKTNLAYLIYVLAGIGLVVFVIWWNGRRLIARARELKKEVDKATEVIRKQKEVVETEKKKSDDLLLNILPEEVAEELKNTGNSRARSFENITVLFTDFKSFTQFSEKISAEELVAELNNCFRIFDSIIEKYNIEKIKTIGDSYMAASGLGNESPQAVKNAVLAALEMQAFIVNLKTERDTRGESSFEMRVGIHSGPVVAGIVGVKKFAYDIWGDTVNTASRMESSGAPGRVNISEYTYEILKNDPDLVFTPRGKVMAKGKGEMDMYFVDLADISRL